MIFFMMYMITYYICDWIQGGSVYNVRKPCLRENMFYEMTTFLRLPETLFTEFSARKKTFFCTPFSPVVTSATPHV
jgi:hypothetical protein